MSVFNLHFSKIKLFFYKTADSHKVSRNKNLKPDKCYGVIPPSVTDDAAKVAYNVLIVFRSVSKRLTQYRISQ